jgi:hypothetical protein
MEEVACAHPNIVAQYSRMTDALIKDAEEFLLNGPDQEEAFLWLDRNRDSHELYVIHAGTALQQRCVFDKNHKHAWYGVPRASKIETIKSFANTRKQW